MNDCKQIKISIFTACQTFLLFFILLEMSTSEIKSRDSVTPDWTYSNSPQLWMFALKDATLSPLIADGEEHFTVDFLCRIGLPFSHSIAQAHWMLFPLRWLKENMHCDFFYLWISRFIKRFYHKPKLKITVKHSHCLKFWKFFKGPRMNHWNFIVIQVSEKHVNLYN